jgi:hypothetical protein
MKSFKICSILLSQGDQFSEDDMVLVVVVVGGGM